MRLTKEKSQIIILLVSLLILSGLYFIYRNYTNEKIKIVEFSIFCDFETQNDSSEFITNNKDYILDQGMTSKDIVFEGKQSLYIPKWKLYQGLVTFNNLKPNSNVKITFKRYKTSKASVVAQGIDAADFYKKSNEATPTNENGWDDVYLNFTCGNTFNDTLKIYILNLGKEETYIDNLKISVSDEPFYPNFETEEPLLIYIEDKEFDKIQEKRKEALNRGVLITEDDSWVDALVYGEGKMMQAEIRLKGDWLDHLRGDKWSYRIKLKYDSWKGMRVFSIHHPNVRGYLNEWLIHKTCNDIDILNTRYGFVPVFLNGNSIGLYAYEEHFSKELIESSLRREGVIIKYSETDFWYFMLQNNANGYTYVTSVIEPFGTGKIMEDSIKFNQFIIGANLLDMYRTMGAKASDIFDVKKMAKFIAFVNSRNAFHALEWLNVRYYYNPVLCRLEPIAFDMFANEKAYSFENPLSPMIKEDLAFHHTFCISYMMTDSVFYNEYFRYLDMFTNELDYENLKQKYNDKYVYYDSLCKLEFSPYSYDTVQFSEILKKIDKFLPIFKDSLNKNSYLERIHSLKNTPLYIGGLIKQVQYGDLYVKVYKQSENSLMFKCFLQYNIDIIGLGNENQIKKDESKTITNLNSGIVKNIVLNFNANLNDYSHVYFKIQGVDSVFKCNIVPWPAPTTYNPRTDIAQSASDISKFTNEEKREIRFSGNISFDNHVYIPAGYTVTFDAGTNIDITNKSVFISNSTILINGTKENPVKIHSSDMSANGFTILQAEEKSVCNYAVFENLNTINYNGWLLTGAVTFYESDVEFYNCTFTNNHCEDMLNTVRCNFIVKDCLLQNTFGDSHDSDFCTGTLDNCTFINNGNDAIDFSTSDVVIKNCNIKHSVDKAISVGENTKALIQNVIIDDAGIGIAAKDLSNAEIDNCIIKNTVYGFVLLQKKPEFGPATITATNCKLEDVWKDYIIEAKSVLNLNGETHQGSMNKLKSFFYE